MKRALGGRKAHRETLEEVRGTKLDAMTIRIHIYHELTCLSTAFCGSNTTNQGRGPISTGSFDFVGAGRKAKVIIAGLIANVDFEALLSRMGFLGDFQRKIEGDGIFVEVGFFSRRWDPFARSALGGLMSPESANGWPSGTVTSVGITGEPGG